VLPRLRTARRIDVFDQALLRSYLAEIGQRLQSGLLIVRVRHCPHRG
jgi:hypothetical protein